jgi:hypothetical protein
MTIREAHALIDYIVMSHPDLTDVGNAFFLPSIEAVVGRKVGQLCRNMRAFLIWREFRQQNNTNLQAFGRSESIYFYSLLWKTLFLALNMPFTHAQDPQRTLEVPSSNGELANIPHTPLQEPCRVALLIFWNACNGVNQPGSLIFQTLASLLRSALEDMLEASNMSCLSTIWSHFAVELHGLLLWIILMGAFVTHDVSTPRSEQGLDEVFFSEVIVEFQQRSTRMGSMMRWEEVEEVIKPFLYVDRILADRMRSCWNTCLAAAKS